MLQYYPKMLATAVPVMMRAVNWGLTYAVFVNVEIMLEQEIWNLHLLW